MAGKPAAISGITPRYVRNRDCSGPPGVALISLLNMDIMNYPRLTIPNAMQQLDEHGKLALKESAPYLEKQANAFYTLY